MKAGEGNKGKRSSAGALFDDVMSLLTSSSSVENENKKLESDPKTKQYKIGKIDPDTK